jgi:hypothetical protein
MQQFYMLNVTKLKLFRHQYFGMRRVSNLFSVASLRGIKLKSKKKKKKKKKKNKIKNIKKKKKKKKNKKKFKKK